MSFLPILQKYRKDSFSERDKGSRFERLMQAYLKTDPQYAFQFQYVWLWNEFPGKNSLGDRDTGIDLVALTYEGHYWAIQCKCFQENSSIEKADVDTFLSTSGREFRDALGQPHRFAQRLWISTTNKWTANATESLNSQEPPVSRLNLSALSEAPVNWEKLEEGVHGELARNPKKSLRPHQKEALDKAHSHFLENDRGKLIMACGTGKTFTALRIAENETGGKGLILFLVPSIALLGQTLREWSADADEPINAIAICSDPEISRQRKKNEDTDSFSVVDLAYPASTDSDSILDQFEQIRKNHKPGMTVVFSTYQSIAVIARAQRVLLNKGFPEFDLIICDEAHRTTGVTLAGEDESAFVKVHESDYLKAKKRLYMTATPRLFSDDARSKAAQAEAILCSMDDVNLYGEEIYRIGFGEAVERGLLTDYKVLILTLSDKDVPPAIQRMLSKGETEISTDDISKLIGTVNALSKQFLGDDGVTKEADPKPMKRAVAFCGNIAVSRQISATYNTASEAYLSQLPAGKRGQMVTVEAQHMDGTMAAPTRDQMIAWLKAETAENECRIITNVRVLSEGVDVPSLDAVLFLSARNSQVDVVQSVGRVMRKAPGKEYGYIIIPVVVPSDVEASKALDDNERYKVVWTVLNALRAHDDRFNATVNKLELNRKKPNNILVGRPEYSFDEDGNPSQGKEDSAMYETSRDIGRQLAIQFEELQSVVFARMVQKVGDRLYWEQWAKDVAQIAERQVERITYLIDNKKDQRKAFDRFLEGLQKNINPSITENQAVDMLAQHIITQPIFEALFDDYSFVKNNPVSLAMQNMLNALEDGNNLAEQDKTLQRFYESVQKRAEGIDNAEGKQRIIIELYDKFFRTAFPKMVEQLGIVYTPVEVVDFIIRSVEDVLQKEFGRSISDENVHILDPFTGTGTFMTRLLQSGLIAQKDLARKYQQELHANEIVLLAYYIAAVNIENAYYDAVWGLGYGGQGLGFGQGLGKNKNSDYGENKFIQGTDGVAGSDESGGDDLLGNKELSKGRDIWLDKSDPEGRNLHSSEHSRRLRTEQPEGIPPFSRDSERLIDGVRNSYSDRTTNPDTDSGGNGNLDNTDSNSGQDFDRTTQIPNPQPLNPTPHYQPFEGIVLTDTFQLGETDESQKLFSEMFPQNSERVVRQKKAPLRVIMGNPPYSVGQKSANDNAQNQKYEILDSRISITYAKATSATNKNSLYDSYIKAFRWSTDRLDPVHGGIIAFVSNGAWLDGNSSDGFRKVLEREFSSIWVFNLRGNARTQGELRQKEAGNVFGSGSRTPIAITLLVKKPGKSGGKAAIHYHDIGDYLNREEKLTIIRDFGSLNRIPWTLLQPNDQGDWISQRNDVFGTFLPLGDKEDKMNKATFFIPYYSNGLKTQRDAWCYNSSIMILKKNIGTHLDFYNEQRIAFFETVQKSKVDIKSFVDRRPQKISWTRALEWDVEKNKPHKIEDGIFVKAYYRPFFKQNLYFSKGLNEMQYQLPKLFPTPSHKNRVICVSANYKDGSVLISDHIPDLHFNGDTQAFPLYYYEENQDVAPTLFDKPGEGKYIRRDGVSDFILERAKNMYGLKGTGFGGRGMGFGVQGLEGLGFGVQGEETNPKPRSPHPIPHHTLSKEDIFYYVYGFLHSPEYRTTFASDLKKMLPRLPLVEDVRDFWAFSNAGRRLAELHIHYESVSPYEGLGFGVQGIEGLGFGVQGIEGLGFGVQGEENQTLNPDPQTLNPKPHTLNPNTPDPKTLFRVEKMRYPKKGQTDTIIYNSKIVITNIPAKAYEYVVNGKSAIDWIMERYAVTTHKESGIKNDPNDWAEEVGNPRYILDLLLSIINVSMQTVEIVEGLPKVGFLKDDLPDLKSEGCGLEL